MRYCALLLVSLTLTACQEKDGDAADHGQSITEKAAQHEPTEVAAPSRATVSETVVIKGTHFDPPPARMQASAAQLVQKNRRFRPMVAAASRKYGIEPELIHAIISQESGYNPEAHSVVGARGLMQMMPATAARMGCRSPYVARCNILGGTRYIRQIIAYTGSAHVQTIAAGYNAGEGAAKSFLNGTPTRSQRINPLGRRTVNGVPPKEWGKGQTYDYARKVAGYYLAYKQHPEYIGKHSAVRAQSPSVRADKRGLM